MCNYTALVLRLLKRKIGGFDVDRTVRKQTKIFMKIFVQDNTKTVDWADAIIEHVVVLIGEIIRIQIAKYLRQFRRVMIFPESMVTFNNNDSFPGGVTL